MHQTKSELEKTDNRSVNTELSSMQHAIKARALTTIENQQNQPRLSTSCKLIFAGLTILTVIGFIILIDYGVAIMQRIFELWMQDELPAMTQPRPDQPFYVTVDSIESTASSAASSLTAEK